jgi:hypothetical protein
MIKFFEIYETPSGMQFRPITGNACKQRWINVSNRYNIITRDDSMNDGSVIEAQVKHDQGFHRIAME